MTNTHPFDTAIALQESGIGEWDGNPGTAYSNFIGAYGGTVSATLLNAVLSDSRLHGHPVTFTVNFCAALGEQDFSVLTKLHRTGKYTQHWSLELTQGERTMATATIVCAARSETFSHQPAHMPAVNGPETYDLLKTKGVSNWIQRYDFRFVSGTLALKSEPNDPLEPSRTVAWVSDNPPRPLDHLSLAALSDSFFLRLMHIRGTMEPAGTVSITTHILATPDEIAAQGTDPILAVADGNRFHNNFHDQYMQLWGSSGKILATGSQIVWFRQ